MVIDAWRCQRGPPLYRVKSRDQKLCLVRYEFVNGSLRIPISFVMHSYSSLYIRYTFVRFAVHSHLFVIRLLKICYTFSIHSLHIRRCRNLFTTYSLLVAIQSLIILYLAYVGHFLANDSERTTIPHISTFLSIRCTFARQWDRAFSGCSW